MNFALDLIKTNNNLSKSKNNFLREILKKGIPKNTVRAYHSDIKYFQGWMLYSGHGELKPPIRVNIIIDFILDHSGGLNKNIEKQLIINKFKKKLGPWSITTIKRRLASLSTFHKIRSERNYINSSQVKLLLNKIRINNVRNGFRLNKKTAIVKNIMNSLLNTCNDSLIGIRDRAIMLFSAASGGRRRSEVSNATFDNLEKRDDGYIFKLTKSKGNYYGESKYKPVLGKAGRALNLWLKESNINDGFLFRPITRWGKITKKNITGDGLLKIVKKRVFFMGKMEGLSDMQAKNLTKEFGFHSLRSGFVTEAGRTGDIKYEAMELSGHKSSKIFDTYYQSGNVINNKAARIFD